jgi:hypothetical protein
MSPVTKVRGLPSRSPAAVDGFDADRFADGLQSAAFVGEGGLDRRERVPFATPRRSATARSRRPRSPARTPPSIPQRHTTPTQTTPPTTASSARAQETQAPRPLATSRSLRRRRTRREQPSPPGKIRPRLNARCPAVGSPRCSECNSVSVSGVRRVRSIGAGEPSRGDRFRGVSGLGVLDPPGSRQAHVREPDEFVEQRVLEALIESRRGGRFGLLVVPVAASGRLGIVAYG